jgi:L-lysine 2,3-aminomutase
VAENAVFLGGDFAAPIERKVAEVEWETWAYKVAEVTSVKRNFHDIFKMAADKCFRMEMAAKNFQFQILYIFSKTVKRYFLICRVS